MSDNFFHAMFILIFMAFVAIRVSYHWLAARSAGKVEYRESKPYAALRLVLGTSFMATLFIYMVWPPLLAWTQLPMPVWLQWVGVVMGVASVLLIWWVHHALGANFSSTLHLRAEHTLVTYGPYRWVRHPMYTAFYLHMIALSLLTRSWFIGSGLLGLTLVIMIRLKNEEDTMVERFGDSYRSYMQRTGRFLPRRNA